MRGGAPPYRNNFIGRASSGRNRNAPAKNGPPALCSLLARWLAWNVGFSFDRAVKRPQPYTIWQGCTHASKVLTKGTLTPEAVRTPNRLPKSVITAQRSTIYQRKASPSDVTNDDISSPEVSFDHTGTRGNTRSAVILTQKQVNKQNLYFAGNWSS